MGTVHFDHAPYSGTLYQLHPPGEEDTSSA